MAEVTAMAVATALQVLVLTTLVSSALTALLSEAVRDGRGPELLLPAASQPTAQDVYAFGFHESEKEESSTQRVETSETTLGAPSVHKYEVTPPGSEQGRIHEMFSSPDVQTTRAPVSSADGSSPGATISESKNSSPHDSHADEAPPDNPSTTEGINLLNASDDKKTGGLLDSPVSILNDDGLSTVRLLTTSDDITSTELSAKSRSGTVSNSTVPQDSADVPETVVNVSSPEEHSEIWNYRRTDGSGASTSVSDDSFTTYRQPVPPTLGADTEKNRPKCRQSLSILNCSRLRLETFYTSTRLAYIEELILSFNRLKNLMRDTFAGMKSLQKLYLDHNGISFVSEDAFSDLPDLKVLDLSFNRVQQLAPVTFSQNPQLFILNLSGNPLEVAGLGSWLRSDSLGVLYLNACNATSLPADAFAGVTELLYLHVCSNGLRQLPPQLFRQLTDLRHLYLDHNQLSSLPADIFSENLQLEWLFVRHNRVALSADEPFLNASSLLMLDLEDNRVSSVGMPTFAGLQGLHNLTLRKNAIRRWAGLSPALPRLRYLDLSWNRLRLDDLLPFPPYPRLACANLGGNPAACDPSVSPEAFCVSGCRVSTPPKTAAATVLTGNCTRRLLVKFSADWVPRASTLGASWSAGGSVREAGSAAEADAEAEAAAAARAARVEAAVTAAYAGAAATILVCLAATAAVAAFLAVRGRRRRRSEERLLAAYSRRSLRPRLERLEAMSRAADSLEALNSSAAGGGGSGSGGGAGAGAEAALRTATVGRTATLTRAAAAASLVAAETPLLAANGDAASGHYNYVDITCWLPERRRPPTTAGRKLF